VYFAIARFPGYGRLSRLDTREIKAGARVLQDEYGKENPQDFALWKAATEVDERTGAAWDSPWGRGRPGWHLECSAMAMALLGETIDLHCGGVDLVFPHHEDEIAQSEAATGRPFSRGWCHGEFLQVDGSKMAKRLGNSVTVRALRDQGVSAAAIRHFVFGTHYRKQLNLTDEALDASREACGAWARSPSGSRRRAAGRPGSPRRPPTRSARCGRPCSTTSTRPRRSRRFSRSFAARTRSSTGAATTHRRSTTRGARSARSTGCSISSPRPRRRTRHSRLGRGPTCGASGGSGPARLRGGRRDPRRDRGARGRDQGHAAGHDLAPPVGDG
jgi:cysteinyl-tRNA synthetase